MEYKAPEVPPIVSSTKAARDKIPETALDKGSELAFKAARIAFDPATRVSPQSPSPAICQ